MNQQINVKKHSDVRLLEVILGLVVLGLIGYALPIFLLRPIEMSAATGGVVSALLSGVATFAGFFVAAKVRRHHWADFGIKSTTQKWLYLGAVGGFLGLLGKLILVPIVVWLTGTATDTQAAYVAGSSGSSFTIFLMVIGLVILTPIGEEFLFRGVLTTSLLRYGWVIGVLGSSVIFAIAHGFNSILPAALVIGIIAAELRRRSGSVWPGVITHAVNNSITVFFYSIAPNVF